MATRKRQYKPGDAANVFVRVLLSEAGELAGGLDDEEWAKTLEFFGHRCAYTGEELTEDSAEQEHAIPINRHHCGLHLYGNVVPSTRKANEDKGGKHFEHFVDDHERLQKIKEFMAKAEYYERAKPFEGLQAYCQTQYDVIVALCKTNADYLKMLLPKLERHTHDQEGVDGGGTSEPHLRRKATMTALAKDCIRERFNDQKTLEIVKKEFPELRTDIRGIQSIRSRMRGHDKSIPMNKDLKLKQDKR